MSKLGKIDIRLFLIRSVACAVLLLTVGIEARAGTLSVMEFNEKLKEWRTEQKQPPPLTYTVEGRVTLFSKDRLRLMGCKDVLFVSKAELPELSRKSSNIEVSGKITVDPRSGEYTFEISSAREVASDVEKFHDLRRKLRQQPAEKWYELGKWADARGTFYKDHELRARSEEAYASGFELERKELARDNPQGLLDLAEKAKLYQLPSGLRQELTHEAWHLLCKRSDKLPAAGLEDLAKRMSQSIPDCTKPPRFLQPELIQKYKKAPLETYASADTDARHNIHRILYSDLIMRAITSGLAADGSNGFEIAHQIDERVREQHAIAESYRDKALAAQASEVKTLTRSQVVDLADQYRARQKPKQADQLLESWLTLRGRDLEPDDTEGLLDLSEDYRRMINRRDLANRMLIDGWKRNPKAPDIAERLEKEGYHLDAGNWLTAAEFNSRPEGQFEKAIRAGRVDVGMTVSHVRRSLGEPESVARAVTSGQVTEVWKYGQTSSTHQVIRLVKRGGQSELTVVDVGQHRVP